MLGSESRKSTRENNRKKEYLVVIVNQDQEEATNKGKAKAKAKWMEGIVRNFGALILSQVHLLTPLQSAPSSLFLHFAPTFSFIFIPVFLLRKTPTSNSRTREVIFSI